MSTKNAAVTVDSVDAITDELLRRDAKAKAEALDRALTQSSAEAVKLDGTWYVLMTGTGEGYAFAYDPDDLDRADLARPDWDYSAWCSGVSPMSDKRVAIACYMKTDHWLGEGGASSILTEAEYALLDLVKKVK